MEAKHHVCAHAKELGITSDVCEIEQKIKESEDVVALRKKIFDLEDKLNESEKINQALKKKHVDFRKLVESVIPQPSIFGAWRPGSKLMVQQLQRVLRESSDSVTT